MKFVLYFFIPALALASNSSKDLPSDEATIETLWKASGCPFGSNEYQNQCYKLFTDKKTFSKASKVCENGGGNLATIPDKNLGDFLDGIKEINDVQDYIWHGLVNSNGQGLYYWLDGHPFQPDYFPIDCSLDKFVSLACFGMKAHTGWNQFDCREKRAFVCQFPISGYCSKGWTYNEKKNRCYKHVTQAAGNITWDVAEKLCQLEDAHLASIADKQENDFIRGSFKQVDETAWFGFFADESQTLHWIDGFNGTWTPLTFKPALREVTYQHQCGILVNGANGQLIWNFNMCFYNVNGFVCKKKPNTDYLDIVCKYRVYGSDSITENK